jgi:hypothetical protein
VLARTRDQDSRCRGGAPEQFSDPHDGNVLAHHQISDVRSQARAVAGRSRGHYIIGERMRAGMPGVEAALSRQGRYRVVRDNLEVKDVTVGDGEARLRYVICRNPVEAERDREQREQLVSDLEAALAVLDQTRGVHAKGACALRISRRFGRYVKQSSAGRLSMNAAVLHQEERLDGKYLLRSSHDTLSAEDIALGYRQLLEVERGWRDLRQHLELRPIYHRREDRITAHVLLCFLGPLLVRVAERATGQTWPRLRRELQRVALVEFSGPAGRVSQRTELTPVQAGLFEALAVPVLEGRLCGTSGALGEHSLDIVVIGRCAYSAQGVHPCQYAVGGISGLLGRRVAPPQARGTDRDGTPRH